MPPTNQHTWPSSIELCFLAGMERLSHAFTREFQPNWGGDIRSQLQKLLPHHRWPGRMLCNSLQPLGSTSCLCCKQSLPPPNSLSLLAPPQPTRHFCYHHKSMGPSTTTCCLSTNASHTTTPLATTVKHLRALQPGDLPLPGVHTPCHCATQPVTAQPTPITQQPGHHCRAGRGWTHPQLPKQKPLL